MNEELEKLCDYMDGAPNESQYAKAAEKLKEAVRAQLDQQASAVTDERAAFEAAWIDVGGMRMEDYDLSQGVNGNYGDDEVQAAWEIWQARALLSAQQASPAVADGELPPLPPRQQTVSAWVEYGVNQVARNVDEPTLEATDDYYTADQMRAYVLADRQECARKAGAGEVVAKGFVLVPMHLTPEMQSVLSEEDWAWEDLLAAAEVITEEEHEAIARGITPAPAAVPQEPVAHLRYRCGQQWSGNGNHDIQHGEWLEVCEPEDKSDGGSPAFPVYATPPAAPAVEADAKDAERWRTIEPHLEIENDNGDEMGKWYSTITIKGGQFDLPGSPQYQSPAEGIDAAIAAQAKERT